MARFSLRQLELLAELPRHSTLGSAAAELNISESALSQAITAVERISGEQLCVRRKSHGVHMTPAGHYFAAKAARIVADAEELGIRSPVRMGPCAVRSQSGASRPLPATWCPLRWRAFAPCIRA